ncbi:MAG: hypothetical protein WCT05_04295, partial [Lentisphaeria bacterium]
TAGFFSGCLHSSHEVKTVSEVKPIEIKPIHITIDINVKVDKALDDFFGDIDQSATHPLKETAK